MHLQRLSKGFSAFPRGIIWLNKNRFELFLLFLPMIISIVAIILSWGFLSQIREYLLNLILFEKPEHWFFIAIHWIIKAILTIALFTLSLVIYPLCMNIISSPFYEYVSHKVEKSLGNQTQINLNFFDSLKLMLEELKKITIIFVITTFLLLIPGVNILSPLIAAFLIAWDFYDFPLARRAWTFKERFKYVIKRADSLIAFGLWMLIPGVQFIMMPLAVAGGSILAIEDLHASKIK